MGGNAGISAAVGMREPGFCPHLSMDANVCVGVSEKLPLNAEAASVAVKGLGILYAQVMSSSSSSFSSTNSALPDTRERLDG